jgi:hypothetical protein
MSQTDPPVRGQWRIPAEHRLEVQDKDTAPFEGWVISSSGRSFGLRGKEYGAGFR